MDAFDQMIEWFQKLWWNLSMNENILSKQKLILDFLLVDENSQLDWPRRVINDFFEHGFDLVEDYLWLFDELIETFYLSITFLVV